MKKETLYDKSFEHDACGIGAVVNIDGSKSHSVVSDALTIVEKLEHRAGKDASGEVGDGVGILVQVSHSFFSKIGKELGIELGEERDYGVGMFFFPQDSAKRHQAKKMFETVCRKEKVEFLGWRKLSVKSEILGKVARDCQPYIEQCFVKRPANVAKGFEFDKILYVIRRLFEQGNEDIYVSSLSSRTIVYKGMFLVKQLREFYVDLHDEDYKSAMAMVHSRFSTNTNPSWERAHPNRVILHNGEINTIRGNVDRMFAREDMLVSPFMDENKEKILPVVDVKGSDSSRLDNTLEFLYMNGIELPLSVMLTIPEPYKHDNSISQERKDFYNYYATMMEPWDGPAAILFSDGDVMGAVLDRNGLRPSRYYITTDNKLILSSEVGVLDIDPAKIVKKSRVKPGEILLVDTVAKKLITNDECKDKYASRRPYGEWLDFNLLRLKDIKVPNKKVETHSEEDRAKLYKVFGYT
ncbi:MAG: glutamate synthase subunit alpha, partial [Bacillota bacterium]